MRNLSTATAQMFGLTALAAFVAGRGSLLFASRPIFVLGCVLLGVGLLALGVRTFLRRTVWLTAIHEAGHVAVSVALFGPADITEVAIHRDGSGETTSWRAGDETSDERLAATLYAGRCAERVFFGHHSFGGGDDLERIDSMGLDADRAYELEAQSRAIVECNIAAIVRFARVLAAARTLTGERLLAVLLDCSFEA